MSTVLVAYATTYGSTQQVAETITATLRDQGVRAECRPARTVRDPVQGLDLVVLGAPLYNGRWHRDAHWFLERHRHRLPPVAAFGMGPCTEDAAAWLRSRAQLDRALAKHPWLASTNVALFGGVDPPGESVGRDLRDWVAIATWAALLPHRVTRPTGPPP